MSSLCRYPKPTPWDSSERISTVVGLSRHGMVQVTANPGLSAPPPWFEHLGAAITGLQMVDSRDPQTLVPLEHEVERKAFLEDPRVAAERGDTIAAHLRQYFEGRVG